MIAYYFGQSLGVFLAALLIPALLLAVLLLVPTTRNMHRMNYGITGALAAGGAWLSVAGGADVVIALIAAKSEARNMREWKSRSWWIASWRRTSAPF
jgi:hypothetical protein